ncbi:MutS2 family protein [Paenibacillus uliginis N3/975]|uniref:MutS2 family protein n=1 Tax=Paenibacillus uliginis N3/975 TaxID=1313296 RepID=A0A1X7HI17_9BACL|nr:DNA mismatch repair protein MutS [Paenibacillus uliginis]SMF87064.1 MutS2 family protein [Paenibacillus uliginis N3/975]
MNLATMKLLQYDKVQTELERFAVSYLGKNHIREITPLTQIKAIRLRLDETSEASTLLRAGASIPIPSLEGIEPVQQLLGTGYVLTERDFGHIQQFLRSCKQLIRYMATKSEIAPKVASYASSMYELPSLLSEIEHCIYSGRVVDGASKELARVRKKIAVSEERVKRKLDSLLSKHRSIMQESLVSKRNGRYVLPIKKEHRKQINGVVLDESASGQTVYIEPSDVASLQHELSFLQTEEAREETKVLSALTEMAEKYSHELKLNADTVGMYDFIIARGKYGMSISGRNVELNDQGIIALKQATHPLLGPGMVPLDFAIGRNYKSLIITGPNTGGKTLTLKTVGLLTMMVQSGLLIPVQEGSQCSIYEQISVDIGDGQSIEHALSTFSAHIRNVNHILQTANDKTLILLDEMASGTDPGEGIGLSIAVLEELHRRRATVVVTTHFTEIKNFARITPGFENARMEFDTETLEPKYRLKIGEAGQSYAFVIAEKLGIPSAIIARSREISEAGVGHENTMFPSYNVTTNESYTDETRELAGDYNPDPLSVQDNQDLDALSSQESHDLKGAPEVTNHSEDQKQENLQSPSPPAYQLGDSVYVSSLNRTGIVCEAQDSRGMVGVMIQKQKIKINHKRLTLHIAGKNLYPEDYDMDIVFESKENRKKRKLMNRKHVEGLTIEIKPES